LTNLVPGTSIYVDVDEEFSITKTLTSATCTSKECVKIHGKVGT